jgi:putative ABC transport system substrate-binding protein
MHRRAYIGFTAVGLVFPGVLVAQAPKKAVRIAYLNGYSEEVDRPFIAGFRQGLAEHGWVEGRNLVLDARYASGQTDRFPKLAAELAALKPDLYVVLSEFAALAARKVAGNLPIVMANVQDPVASGLVTSLARPGGNITGMSDFHSASVTKRLELMKEAIPGLSRVGVMWIPSSAPNVQQLRDLEAAAPVLNVSIVSLPIKEAADIAPAIDRMKGQRGAALLLLGDILLSTNMRLIADRALGHRLPAVYTIRPFVHAGGFMAYGTDFVELYRRSAIFVDKILKGAKPADLPIEQPTKFELLVNLKTAKALGITVPRSVLLRADQVIE